MTQRMTPEQSVEAALHLASNPVVWVGDNAQVAHVLSCLGALAAEVKRLRAQLAGSDDPAGWLDRPVGITDIAPAEDFDETPYKQGLRGS
jgi:hypothetical protein